MQLTYSPLRRELLLNSSSGFTRLHSSQRSSERDPDACCLHVMPLWAGSTTRRVCRFLCCAFENSERFFHSPPTLQRKLNVTVLVGAVRKDWEYNLPRGGALGHRWFRLWNEELMNLEMEVRGVKVGERISTYLLVLVEAGSWRRRHSASWQVSNSPMLRLPRPVPTTAYSCHLPGCTEEGCFLLAEDMYTHLHACGGDVTNITW